MKKNDSDSFLYFLFVLIVFLGIIVLLLFSSYNKNKKTLKEMTIIEDNIENIEANITYRYQRLICRNNDGEIFRDYISTYCQKNDEDYRWRDDDWFEKTDMSKKDSTIITKILK